MRITLNSTRERGQTTLDFAIAMGVFLLAVAFVFTFIPTMTAPFLDGDQELSAASDRTASHLADGGLGDPGTPYVVEEACATSLFNHTSHHEDCGFDSDTRTHLGLSERLDVEVKIVRVYPIEEGSDRRQLVCRTADGDVSDEKTAGNCETTYKLSTDDTPDYDRSITVSRRVVSMEDCSFDNRDSGGPCDVTLIVRMW